ncbi:hypothetical protein EGY08_19840 [Klebsiella sp. FDAARGOS_511]|nr:hypothetical protein EGY08_19840 [Klebsiella sp. FDAARGOS_511]
MLCSVFAIKWGIANTVSFFIGPVASKKQPSMRRFLPDKMFYFVMYFKDMSKEWWGTRAGGLRPACGG